MAATDASDFLERVASLLALAPKQAADPRATDADGSLLGPPGDELSRLRSFCEIYGGGNALLPRLADAAEETGDDRLVAMIRALAQGIDDRSLQRPAEPKPVRRFGGFVYPVV